MRRRQRLLLWLGTRCYSLYLVQPSRGLLAGDWLGSAQPWVRVALGGTSLAFLAAHLSYRYVELPFMQLGKRLNGKARVSVPAGFRAASRTRIFKVSFCSGRRPSPASKGSA